VHSLLAFLRTLTVPEYVVVLMILGMLWQAKILPPFR
jgi:hypothetical protein